MAKNNGKIIRKNGKIKDGKLRRRGNKTGTIFRKTDKSGKEYGKFFLRFSERTPEGKRVRIVFPTTTESRKAAREALDAKAEELGFGSDDTKHLNALLKAKTAIDNEQALKEQKAKEAAEKQKQEEEAAAAAAAEQELLAKSIDIQSAFTYFRASKSRRDCGATTLAGYEGQYSTFARWMKRKYPKCRLLRDVTPKMAESFLDFLEKSRSRNTYNKYLTLLRSIWNDLSDNDDAHLTINPWAKIRTRTVTPDEVTHRDLTVEELGRIAHVLIGDDPIPGQRILDASYFQGKNIRHELLVLFAIGLYTGLRLGDCATLQWSYVDLIKNIIDTIPLKTKRKYARRVIIPIHPALAAILQKHHIKAGKGKYVLPSMAKMYTGERANLTNRTQAVFRAAKIETTAEAPEGGEKARTLVGFHSLRHSFASLLLNNGAQFDMVEKMLGHSSDSMTAHYFHTNAIALSRNIAKLPVVSEMLPEGAALPQIEVLPSTEQAVSAALNDISGLSKEKRAQIAAAIANALK